MWGIGDIAGLLSTAGEFFKSIISVELEPRHKLFLSFGVNLAGIGMFLIFVLALVWDLTSSTPILGLSVAGGIFTMGILSIGIGLIDGRDVEKIRRQRRQEKLEQAQAETERARAETGIYQAGRDTLEGRKNSALSMRNDDRELHVETQTFGPMEQDDNSESESGGNVRGQETEQGSHQLEEHE